MVEKEQETEMEKEKDHESDCFEMMAFLREPDRVLERLLIQANLV